MAQSDKRGTKDTQESIRIKAVKMRLKGTRPGVVAETFGITTQALSKMMKKYEEGGFKALKNKIRGKRENTGRRLTEDQEFDVYRIILDKCPDQLKFPFALWTREAIRHLILD